MEFTFATAGSIHFGAGTARRLPEFVVPLGSHVFLVTGERADRHVALVDDLPVVGTFALAHEPTMDDARRATAEARASGADVVVAIGGGSVIDLAKAVGVLVTSGADPLDHAEVIGAARPLPASSVPVVAVPTTAGTGSEVTRNAVLSSPEHQVKVSLRGPAMLPRLAVVDPELALGCPAQVSGNSGMDALTQCLEPFTSSAANPLTDGFCRTGLGAAARSLRTVCIDPDDLDARTDMALCSLMGGLALANAKLGAVHGLAGVLGGVTGAPHGAICGTLLPSVTMVNIAAMRERDPDNPALGKYAHAAELLCGVPALEAAVAWIDETVRFIEVDGLQALGFDPSRIDWVVEQAQRSSSMKGNPIELTADELRFVLENSL